MRRRVVAVAVPSQWLAKLAADRKTELVTRSAQDPIADLVDRSSYQVVLLGETVTDPVAVTRALPVADGPVAVVVLARPPAAGLDPLRLLFGRSVRRLDPGRRDQGRRDPGRLDQGRLDQLDAVLAELFTELEQAHRHRVARAQAQRQLTAAGIDRGRRQLGERMFGELLTRAPIGALLVDPAGRLVGWNVRAAELFGLRDPASLHTDLTRFFHRPDAVGTHLGTDGSGPDPAADPTATFSLPRGEHSGHLRLTVQPTTDDTGRPRLLVLAEDVTELLEAQLEIVNRSRESVTVAEVASAMAAAGSTPERLRRCAEVISAQFGIAAVAIWTLDRPGGGPRLRSAAGPAAERLRRHGVAGLLGAADGGTGTLVQLPLVVTEPVAEVRAEHAANGDREASLTAYHLVSGEEAVGILGLLHHRPLPAATLAALPSIAGQIAVGIRQDQLYRRVRSTAEALQRPLLPPQLPAIDGLELAGRYRAFGDGTRIGGDFYDVFPLPDGRYAAALGDVCGKGPEAAAVTGLVRHTIWTAAQHRPDPEYVLPLVNQALLRAGGSRFCTLTYAVLERSARGWWSRLSCAGHPPPVVLSDSGARLVDVGGLLLGVLPTLDVPAAATVPLEPGARLLCYTDGFTEGAGGERRRRPADLATEVAGLADRYPGAGPLADALLDSTVDRFGDALRDDLALLVLAVTPGRTGVAAGCY